MVQDKQNTQLQSLLLSAPTLSDDELQEYAQVREWMNQWTRGETARRLAGMGRPWLSDDVDPIADLIAERVQDDEEEGL